MTETKYTHFSEEVIDLRELIRTLWAKKWLILGVTFIAGLAAFLVSSFLVPERYQAAAFITITEPNLRAELETSIQTEPVPLETSGLVELAESAELQALTFSALGVTDYEQQRSYEFSAVMQGEGQLRLGVTTEDPVLAAEAANAWAGVVSERLNELYGTSQETLTILESEAAQAKIAWAEAQEALETYLPECQVESLTVELSEQKKNLARYINQIEGNRLLISDAETMLAQLVIEEDGEVLATGTALSIIALQQRAAGGVSGTQFQIQGDQIMGVDYPADKGRETLLGLIAALQEQNLDFEMEIELIQEGLGEISSQLESERFKVDQLSQERDLARQAYTALSSQLEETRITWAQEDRPVKIGAQAVVPQHRSSPNVLLLTALVALMASVLSILVVLLAGWFQEGEHENKL